MHKQVYHKAFIYTISQAQVLFFVQAERVWQVAFCSRFCFVGFVLHFEFNGCSILQLGIPEIFFRIRLAIHLHGFYVTVSIAVGRSLYSYGFPVFQFEGSLFEQGCTNNVFIGSPHRGVLSVEIIADIILYIDHPVGVYYR